MGHRGYSVRHRRNGQILLEEVIGLCWSREVPVPTGAAKSCYIFSMPVSVLLTDVLGRVWEETSLVGPTSRLDRNGDCGLDALVWTQQVEHSGGHYHFPFFLFFFWGGEHPVMLRVTPGSACRNYYSWQ